MFGPEDRLLNWFAVQAGALPFIPMIDSGSGVGGDALTKPVYMGDVSDAIFRIIMKVRLTLPSEERSGDE